MRFTLHIVTRLDIFCTISIKFDLIIFQISVAGVTVLSRHVRVSVFNKNDVSEIPPVPI